MNQNKEKSGTGEKKRDTYRTRFAALAKSFLKIGAFTFWWRLCDDSVNFQRNGGKARLAYRQRNAGHFAVAECTPESLP